jgi:hypothetical protein
MYSTNTSQFITDFLAFVSFSPFHGYLLLPSFYGVIVHSIVSAAVVSASPERGAHHLKKKTREC